MLFSRPDRFRLTAAALALVLGCAGFAYGARSRAYHKKVHASGSTRSAVRRTASLHRASYRHSRHYRRSRRHPVIIGQRVMDPQRAMEIQQALIQAHYLSGSPTGQWDPETQAAMVKYQTDNSWQSKITPDSRALIKLGLGPKQDAGEYSSTSSGVSKLSEPTPADPIRTLATSELPATTQN